MSVKSNTAKWVDFWIFFENTLVHSRGNKNLPSFFFVFSENNFSQTSGSISNVFLDSITSVKKTIAVGRIIVPIGVGICLDCCWMIISHNIAKNCITTGFNFCTFIFYSLFNFCWYVERSFCTLNFVFIICNRYRVVKYRLYKYITFTNSFYVYWIR